MSTATVRVGEAGLPREPSGPSTSGVGEGVLVFVVRRHKPLEGGAQCQRCVSAPLAPSIPQYRISCGWTAVNRPPGCAPVTGLRHRVPTDAWVTHTRGVHVTYRAP